MDEKRKKGRKSKRKNIGNSNAEIRHDVYEFMTNFIKYMKSNCKL